MAGSYPPQYKLTLSNRQGQSRPLLVRRTNAARTRQQRIDRGRTRSRSLDGLNARILKRKPIRCPIYRSLFVQARGVLKKELQQYLRSKRTIRRSKHATQKGSDHGQIKNMISIRERPASVEDRAVPGHWEGDLITGSRNSHIAPWLNAIRGT